MFDPRNDLVLSSVRIGMDSMNLVTVISRYNYVGASQTSRTIWQWYGLLLPCVCWSFLAATTYMFVYKTPSE